MWNTESRIREARSRLLAIEWMDDYLRIRDHNYVPGDPFGRSGPLGFGERTDAQSSINDLSRMLGKPFDDVYLGRGTAKWLMNDQEGAYEDFAVLLGADHTTIAKGILHYLKSDYQMARDSFLDAVPGSKQETRGYTEIWLWYTTVNLGQFEEANARIRQRFFGESSKRKPSYLRHIARFLLQEITLVELVELASANDPITRGGQLCQASFFAAQVALLMEDMDESAKLLISKCLGTGAWNFYEYRAAAIQRVILSERLGILAGMD